MRLCSRCITPLDEGLIPFLPSNAIPFHIDEGMCNTCYGLQNDPEGKRYFTGIFRSELEGFLKDRKKVTFAYSGGLDSTVVLHRLKKECMKRDIELDIFTVDHGFKGSRTLENIERIIDFEGLTGSFRYIDIKKDIVDGTEVLDYYKNLVNESILPCGRSCNRIIDHIYDKELDSDDKFLITGGDTPKYSSDIGRFSIFWKKQYFTIIRGGIAFGLSKGFNRGFIEKEGLPWKDPNCGGYDTDCLLPGAVLRDLAGGRRFEISELARAFPVMIEYFSERVRWGIIDRDEAIRKMEHIEVSDDFSYDEVHTIIGGRDDN